MKWNVILSCIIISTCISCDNISLVGRYESNDNKRETVKEQTGSKEGVAFYFIQNFDLQTKFDLDTVLLENEPFISDNEIIAYDSAAHIYELNKSGESFFLGEDNLDGKGFVLMVDNDTLYWGVIWSPIHSQSFSNVVLTLPLTESLIGNFVELVEAYPSASFAAEQINLNDERLIARFNEVGKLKTLVEPSESNTGTEPLNLVTDTMYYQNEIFSNRNHIIYGKWSLTGITGGFTGNGYEPNFDYLEIMKYGIYQFVNADTLLEFGKVIIEEQSDRILRISLQTDSSSLIFFSDSEKEVQFTGNDRLDLFAPCCDRYNYHFKRME